jgi:hypothetical protein
MEIGHARILVPISRKIVNDKLFSDSNLYSTFESINKRCYLIQSYFSIEV